MSQDLGRLGRVPGEEHSVNARSLLLPRGVRICRSHLVIESLLRIINVKYCYCYRIEPQGDKMTSFGPSWRLRPHSLRLHLVWGSQGPGPTPEHPFSTCLHPHPQALLAFHLPGENPVCASRLLAYRPGQSSSGPRRAVGSVAGAWSS